MKTLKFKTTLKCGGCVTTISPYMNQIENIESWDVNLNKPEPELKVVTDKQNKEHVRDAVKEAITNAGYSITNEK